MRDYWQRITSKLKAFGGNTANANNKLPANMQVRGLIGTPSPRISLVDAFVGWAAICINVRATTAAKLQTVLVSTNSKGDESALPNDHWLVSLINNPNPFTKTPFQEIKKLAFEWLDYYGNAYLWTPLNGAGVPTQIWVLEPNRVQANPGTDKLIESYNYYNQNGISVIPEYEICHIKTLHPSDSAFSNSLVGSSLMLKAAKDYIESDVAKNNYLNEAFNSGLIQSMTMNLPAGESVDSQEFVNQVKETLNDRLVRSKIVTALPGGMTLASVPTSPIDQAVVSSSFTNSENATVICASFGVPKGLLDGTSNTFATANVSRQILNENTIDPLLETINSRLTIHFRQFDPTVTVKHIPVKYADVTEQIAKDTFLFQNGIISRNELRLREGLGPIDDGDGYWISSGLIPVERALNPTPAQNPEPQSPLDEIDNNEDSSDKGFRTEKKNPFRN